MYFPALIQSFKFTETHSPLSLNGDTVHLKVKEGDSQSGTDPAAPPDTEVGHRCQEQGGDFYGCQEPALQGTM